MYMQSGALSNFVNYTNQTKVTIQYIRKKCGANNINDKIINDKNIIILACMSTFKQFQLKTDYWLLKALLNKNK